MSDVAATLVHLADVLDHEPPATWEQPSLCDRWRVREVVAHVTVPARWPPDAFLAELQADGGDIGRTIDRLAEADGALEPARLLAGLRDDALHEWEPPGGGVDGALVHAVVHALDVLVPLGRDDGFPATPLRAVLDLLASGGVAARFGIEVDGLALEATDLDWRHGDGGRAVRAPATHLAVLLSGRRTGAGSLRGEAG